MSLLWFIYLLSFFIYFFFFYSILLRVELLSWKPTQKTVMMMIVSSASTSLNHLQLRGVEADHHFWSIKFSCFYYFVLLYIFAVKKNKRQPNRNQRKNIIFIRIPNLFKLIVILFCVLYFKLIFNLFASSFSTSSTFHLVSWYFNSLCYYLFSFSLFLYSIYSKTHEHLLF